MSDSFLIRPFSMVKFTIAIDNCGISDLYAGVYACLFIATTRIMLKKQAAESFASRVFLVAGTINFILGTLHVAFALFRLIRAYALLVVPPYPIFYIFDFNRWDNFSHLVILALMTWVADGLVIYRCFLIWRRNYWIIILPTLLVLISMAMTFVNWRWFKHPEDFDPNVIKHIFNMVFPLNLAQNVITTSLIAAKIYMQHRASQRSGLQLSSAINLITIIRIIVESAMIYTVLTIIIIILLFTVNPAVAIPQQCLAPVIGASTRNHSCR
ncbi:hypothetical protein EST38_g6314 [Candolleomyces aberdarensis]|uniref:Uncharacterized protein n=1 Tax=Candolleomyces aberdarensis TaxID=2316362 RepID=A0A4Q2DID8_9AGAR|nr:hypothetical protein EST38_g6314 [Candolleomyces aberdarensis]